MDTTRGAGLCVLVPCCLQFWGPWMQSVNLTPEPPAGACSPHVLQGGECLFNSGAPFLTTEAFLVAGGSRGPAGWDGPGQGAHPVCLSVSSQLSLYNLTSYEELVRFLHHYVPQVGAGGLRADAGAQAGGNSEAGIRHPAGLGRAGAAEGRTEGLGRSRKQGRRGTVCQAARGLAHESTLRGSVFAGGSMGPGAPKWGPPRRRHLGTPVCLLGAIAPSL